jgi:hypothetical protein
MSDERTARIGRNEALFREVNVRIDDLNRTFSDLGDQTMHVVCECGDLACAAGLVVSLSDYERIRADPALFFVEPGHVEEDVEDVVEDQPGFQVVRKHPGEPERIAVETDPRS